MNTVADKVKLLEEMLNGSFERSSDNTREFYGLLHHLMGQAQAYPRRRQRYSKMLCAARDCWDGAKPDAKESQLLQELMDELVQQYADGAAEIVCDEVD